MGYIKGQNRDQLMMPISLNDSIPSDHFVRILDLFVDKMVSNNSDIEFNKGKHRVGRSAYPFEILMKLYIYGFINRISSSRTLEAETYRNIELMFLVEGLTPDHKTISDFRKDNSKAIRTFTIAFRKFLIKEKYVTGNLMATDGTKLKANTSRNSLTIEKINNKLVYCESELTKYLEQLENNDIVDQLEESIANLSEKSQVDDSLLKKIVALEKKVAKLEQIKNELESRDVESIYSSDPEAKTMKDKSGFMPGYNIQSTVDAEHHMIVQMDVTDYQNDIDCLEKNVNAVKEQVELTPETLLADAGYGNEDQLKNLIENEKLNVIVPIQERGNQKKLKKKEGITFTYNKEEDCFYCSEGKKLKKTHNCVKYKGKSYKKYQGKECEGCKKKSKCTRSKIGRIITKRIDDEFITNYKAFLESKENKDLSKMRKTIVEHHHGTIKNWLGQIPLKLRGKEKVQVEVDLVSTSYNFKRLLNIVSFETLMQKLINWA
jgi:transposase